MRVAQRVTGNTADAEDVFQTVFMRLFKSKDRIESEEHLKAWLIRVAINCCYDVLRKRRPTSVLYEETSIVEDEEARLPKTPLERAIDALAPPIRKTVIHLYYYENYSTEEIAEIVGEKPATVRSHLYRVRLLLAWAGGVPMVAVQLLVSSLVRAFAIPVGIAMAGGVSGMVFLVEGLGLWWPWALMPLAANGGVGDGIAPFLAMAATFTLTASAACSWVVARAAASSE